MAWEIFRNKILNIWTPSSCIPIKSSSGDLKEEKKKAFHPWNTKAEIEADSYIFLVPNELVPLGIIQLLKSLSISSVLTPARYLLRK